ncbi:MAG TPA: LytTR family transcriptional regulator DNA-binding domain-containing protein [Bacteroides mediterraneensis]|uniref:LytR/AlgR family response regulator transcription factor n=1 Tax=Bacteroides mediterraneensis TaxID=1841856 RepID=UPI0026F079F4|nr:LytTR family DNA-binding domain-containing protein [Bacteroides mediterraneensis]HJH66374.1 LytTR family transcriptional regulator DNA-binding domain-containing protein [Bacteroides mediterraneensis]
MESCRDYVKIYAGPDEPVQAQLTLKKIEEALPANLFMRVHRSFIVNLSKINVIENNRIVFDSKTYIPIGDLYMNDFQKYINAVLLKS